MSTAMKQGRQKAATYDLTAVLPDYKRTEVGVIPKDWQVEALRKLLSQPATYGIVKAGRFVQQGVPMVRGGDIKDGAVATDLPNVSTEKSVEFSRTVLRKGDILVALVGYPGEAAISPDTLVGANISRAVGLLRPTIKACTEFIVAYLNSPNGRRDFLKPGAGSAQLVVNLRDLNLLRVPLPPPPEQRAIAEALSDVDELLGALDALIAKKRDIKQGAMQQLLTGKTRLPGFSGEWTEFNMATDSTLKARIGWQGLKTSEYLSTGEYYLVTGTDFVNGRIDWTTCHFVDRARFVQDRNIQLNPGDVLLTKDGTIGKAGYIETLPGPATLNSGVFVIRPKTDDYIPLYMFYVLTSRIFEEFLARLQAGSTITHLYQKDFAGFAFDVPSRQEQAAIATVLSDMDTEIAALEARRDKTRAIKQGMMQQLLTGRVRLVKPEAIA